MSYLSGVDSALECLKCLYLALCGHNPSSLAWKSRPLVVSISSHRPDHLTPCCSRQAHLLILFHMCFKLSHQDDGSLLTWFSSFLQAEFKMATLILEFEVISPNRNNFSLLKTVIYLIIFYVFVHIPCTVSYIQVLSKILLLARNGELDFSN